MQTFDVCLGSSDRDAAARVLLTVTDQSAADAIVAAVKGAPLFQCEGLACFARATDRSAPSEAIAAALVSDEAPAVPGAQPEAT